MSGACVIIEVKTDQRLVDQGLGANIPQLIAELLAARYHSDQPNVLGILTDCVGNTCAMQYACSKEAGTFCIQKHGSLDLKQLGYLLATYLSNPNNAVPRATYTPATGASSSSSSSASSTATKPEEEMVVGFKRGYITNPLTTLAWEQYVDLIYHFLVKEDSSLIIYSTAGAFQAL